MGRTRSTAARVPTASTGGSEGDTENGEGGDDRFDEQFNTSGTDTFNGGSGADTADYSSRFGPLVVTIDGVADDGQASLGETDNVQLDVENVKGGSQNDTLHGEAGADTG